MKPITNEEEQEEYKIKEDDFPAQEEDGGDTRLRRLGRLSDTGNLIFEDD